MGRFQVLHALFHEKVLFVSVVVYLYLVDRKCPLDHVLCILGILGLLGEVLSGDSHV